MDVVLISLDGQFGVQSRKVRKIDDLLQNVYQHLIDDDFQDKGG
jgi:hypothetical protein